MKKITRVMAGIMAGAVIPLTLAGCGAQSSGTTTTEATTEATTTAAETTAAATTSSEDAAVEKQISDLQDKLKAFEEAHPDYKDAWSEIAKDYDAVYKDKLNQASTAIEEKINQKAAAKSSEIDPKVIEEYEQLTKETSDMVKKILAAQSAESYETFNVLTKEGETELTIAAEATENPVTEAEVKALTDKIEAFSTAHPEIEEKTTEYFNDVSKIINDEIEAAVTSADQQIDSDVKDILAKHNITEADQQEVNNLLTDTAKEITDILVKKILKIAEQ